MVFSYSQTSLGQILLIFYENIHKITVNLSLSIHLCIGCISDLRTQYVKSECFFSGLRFIFVHVPGLIFYKNIQSNSGLHYSMYAGAQLVVV